MSYNDRDVDRELVLEVLYGLTLCTECGGEESGPDCLCNGEGWLVKGKGSTKKDVEWRFKCFRENKPLTIKWLIDPEVFEEDANPLINSLKKLNIEHTVCKFGIQYDDYIKQFAKEEYPVMFYGCLQFGKFLKKSNITVYCNLPKFECLYYYPKFGEHLLNSNYVMLPFGEILRKKDWLFEHLGEVMFMRPSSGYKTFPGVTVDKASIEREVKHYTNHVDPHELAVVAPYMEIKNEWRFVIVDGKVVTGGQYKKNGKTVRIKEVHESILNYATAVVKNVKYEPDPAWTLDVCEISEGKLKVLEVGSFSCAGLYACDTDAVVLAINKSVTSCTK